MPNCSHFIEDFLHASGEIPVTVNSVQTINASSLFAADYILQLSLNSEAQWVRVSLLSILGGAGCALEF